MSSGRNSKDFLGKRDTNGGERILIVYIQVAGVRLR